METSLIWGISLFLVILGIPGSITLYSWWAEKVNQMHQRRLFERERWQEMNRLASLPKLFTDCLLRVPEQDNPRFARSFGDRWNRLIIWDEQGRAWVGYKCRDVMQSLVDAEYLPGNYWVPFCGPGEQVQSKLVNIDGKTYEMYPTYLKNKPVGGSEWRRWLQAIRNCKNAPYQEYSEMLTNEKYAEIVRKRKLYS